MYDIVNQWTLSHLQSTAGNPQRWETLGEGRELMFEPNEQNQHVISEIWKWVSRTEEKERKMIYKAWDRSLKGRISYKQIHTCKGQPYIAPHIHTHTRPITLTLRRSQLMLACNHAHSPPILLIYLVHSRNTTSFMYKLPYLGRSSSSFQEEILPK